jgi:hypothetical protein
VLRPAGNVERESLQYTKINRTGVKDYADVRMRTSNAQAERSQPITREKRAGVERRVERLEDASGFVSRERVTVKPVVVREDLTTRSVRVPERSDVVRTDRVDRVRSTKDAFVASKRNYEKMREVYDRSGDEGRSDPGKTPARTKSTKVTERASDEARRSVALKDGPSKKSSSGANAKRTRL